jgi:hypothetical protein
MKVTNFGPNGLPITLAGWSTGVVSLNSNVEIVGGGPQALNFVQRITSNTSNTLLNPIVNFASGSNIAFAVQSNTLTIIGAAGGTGAAPTISAGSNSTQVREVSTAGASTTLWSPFDHAHDGIGTITASSSNTMQRGTWNIRPGSGIALSLTDTDGDGEFDTTTIVATGSGGSAGGSLVLISEQVLGGDASAITFTAISSIYKDLIVACVLRSALAAVSDDYRIRVGNGSLDTGANYEYNAQYFGTTASNASGVAQTTMYIGSGAASTSTAGRFSSHEVTLHNYGSTTQARMFHGQATSIDNATRIMTLVSGVWKNTTQAVDQLSVFCDGGTLKTGSRVALYGRT